MCCTDLDLCNQQSIENDFWSPVNLDWITATKLQPSLQGMGSLTWSSTLLWFLVVFHVGITELPGWSLLTLLRSVRLVTVNWFELDEVRLATPSVMWWDWKKWEPKQFVEILSSVFTAFLLLAWIDLFLTYSFYWGHGEFICPLIRWAL